MDGLTYFLIASLLGIGIGAGVGRLLLIRSIQQRKTKSEEQAQLIIKEANMTAESLKKDKILEAKVGFMTMK